MVANFQSERCIIATGTETSSIALLIPEQLVRPEGGFWRVAAHWSGVRDKVLLGFEEVGNLYALRVQTAGDVAEGGQKGKRCRQVNDPPPYRNHHPSPELEQALAQGEDLRPGTGCTRSSQT